jgi:DNA-binding phage protein
MALTRNFKATVKARAQRDAAFREALIRESVECLIGGNMEVGKAMLRHYINATMGFKELGERTAKSSKSLMHMLGPKGNPHARNLFEIIGHLREHEGLDLKVQAVRQGA